MIETIVPTVQAVSGVRHERRGPRLCADPKGGRGFPRQPARVGTGSALRHPRAAPHPARRAAALYLTALSVSVLVAGTGLTLVAVQRNERRLQDNIVRMNEVKWYARAGLKQAFLYMDQIADWRSRVTGGKLIDSLPVGDGTVTVEVFDDVDGNLANNNAQPVRVVSTGTRGGVSAKISAQLKPRPHPSLRYVLFDASSDDMEFKATVQCRGPVRNHGKIKGAAGNTTADDAAFETMTGYTIETPLTPATYVTTAIPLPPVDLGFYSTLATNIIGDYGGRCDLVGYNLTPTSNPEGTPNPNGIYRLNAGGREVRVTNFHLRGTLIITNVGNHPVTFSGGCWIEPGPLGYPVLLIDAPNQDVTLGPSATSMVEATTTLIYPWLGVNLSVLGVDFNENGSLLDTITTQVRGLIWSNGKSFTMNNGSWNFIGTVIARKFIIDNGIKVDNDLSLLYDPPPGFVESGMRLVRGSYREVP